MRFQDQIILWAVCVFITKAIAIYHLGHGLYTLTAVSGLSRPSPCCRMVIFIRRIGRTFYVHAMCYAINITEPHSGYTSITAVGKLYVHAMCYAINITESLCYKHH